MTRTDLWRRLLAEGLGSTLLAAVVIGSGIAAPTALAQSDRAGDGPGRRRSGHHGLRGYLPGVPRQDLHRLGPPRSRRTTPRRSAAHRR